MASSSNPFRALLKNSIPSHIKKMIKHRRGGAARVASERIARMIKDRNAYGNVVEFEIEASKVHWSESGSFTSDEEVNMVTNEETFASLKEEWGGFFRDYGNDLVIGEKFAEGGQAEIFHAKWKHNNGTVGFGVVFGVVKIFKEGWALHDLRKQWPEGMLKKANNDGGYYSSNSCEIYGGLLLENGRFGFLMEAHDCDLRKLIDGLMIQNRNEHPPLWVTYGKGRKSIHQKDEGHALVSIAWGMWALHEHNILHRDLKASNVLYKNRYSDFYARVKRRFMHMPIEDAIEDARVKGRLMHMPIEDARVKGRFMHMSIEEKSYVVTDFECSVGVVGTNYWRAPEILHAVKIGDITPDLFTKAADVYSFSMTCYEVLTGHIPFEDLGGEDYDVVINGKRPKLPKHTHPGLKALLERCWHSNPLERPSFKYIVEELKKIYPEVRS